MTHNSEAFAVLSLVINGEAKEVAAPKTILALLESLEIPSDGVAVELNREVIPRGQHPTQQLASGDKIEIVTFVGGG